VRLDTVPGNEALLYLRNIADADRLLASADAAGAGAPVVVVGGGYIGTEVTAALALRGLKVAVRPAIHRMAAVNLQLECNAACRKASQSILWDAGTGICDSFSMTLRRCSRVHCNAPSID